MSTTLLIGRMPVRDEPLLHPRRGGADRDVLDDRGAEARAEVWRLDVDAERIGDAAVRRFSVAVSGSSQRRAAERGNFAGEAENAKEVGAVRPGGDIEDDVAELFDERAAGRGICRQDENALVLVAEAELLLAQDHARRFDASDWTKLEFCRLASVAVDEFGAFGGKGDLLPDREVRRAANDLLAAVARLHRREPKAVCVGVGSIATTSATRMRSGSQLAPMVSQDSTSAVASISRRASSQRAFGHQRSRGAS